MEFPLFRHKAVRHLAWVFYGEPIFQDILSGGSHFFVAQEWSLELYNISRAWLEELDKDPSPLYTFLNKQKAIHRLGSYFAMLVEYWLRERVTATGDTSVWSCVQLFDAPPANQLAIEEKERRLALELFSELPNARNPKLTSKPRKRNPRRTLGDLDLVFQVNESTIPSSNETIQITHWEAAIKYYIFDEKGLGPCHRIEELGQLKLDWFKGPKSTDTLERKARQCFSATHLLNENPSVVESLRQSEVPVPTRSEVFVKGCLFYPYDLWKEYSIGQGLTQDLPKIAPPWRFQLNPKHWKGWSHRFSWTRVNDNPSLCIPEDHLVAFLPKHDYMGPLHIFVEDLYGTAPLAEPAASSCSHPSVLDGPIELVTPSKAFVMLQQHFSETRLSIMLVHVQYHPREYLQNLSDKLKSDHQWVGCWVEVSRGFVVGNEWPFV